MATDRESGMRIDVNEADEEELMRIEGIDPARARSIVEYRESHGPFESWEAFERIAGLGGQAEEPTQALDEVDVLVALARLDLEAAMAYDAGAEGTRDGDLRDHLRGFRNDHLRHVREINGLLRQYGVEAVEENSGPSEFLLRTLAQLNEPLGPAMLVHALIVNEQLTNGSYAAALSYEWEDPAVDVLERAQQDERRHLEWLMRESHILGTAGEEVPANW